MCWGNTPTHLISLYTEWPRNYDIPVGRVHITRRARYLSWGHTTNSALHRETRKTYVARLQFLHPM